ncbi:XkdX family protein [Bacillus pumilus]|nr:XkdX family protein [Bacillus pumilus]
MNYWVTALYFQWVTPEMAKQAVELGDCSIDDLKEGWQQQLITLEQL